jgi:hypothetical protein
MSGVRGNEVVRKRTKRQVCDAYLNKMLSRPDIPHLEAGFTDRLKRHFDLLPTRYALDINLETLDVLNHMQLLEEARSDPSAVFFHVRIVEVLLHSNTLSPIADERLVQGEMDAYKVRSALESCLVCAAQRVILLFWRLCPPFYARGVHQLRCQCLKVPCHIQSLC